MTATTLKLVPDTSTSWTLERDALKRATAIAARVADRKSKMPMLAHALVRTIDKTHAIVVATDLNVWCWTRIPVASFGSGTFGRAVPAKELADAIKGMANATDVALDPADGFALDLASATTSTRLRGLPEREFPKVPSDEGITYHTCDASALAGLIDSVSHAICKDETRFHLNGIHLEASINGAMIAVATDGHRLTKARRDGAAPTLGTNGVIVPRKGTTEISKLLAEGKHKGTCEIAIKAPYLFMRYGATTLAVKLIDAQFPPYEQVIPKDPKYRAIVPRTALLDALKRAAKIYSETRGVKLAFGEPGFDALTVVADHPDLGEQRERIACVGVAKDYSIGVNPRYLADALAEIDTADVCIGMSDELDPMVARPSPDDGTITCVVMPMRI